MTTTLPYEKVEALTAWLDTLVDLNVDNRNIDIARSALGRYELLLNYGHKLSTEQRDTSSVVSELASNTLDYHAATEAAVSATRALSAEERQAATNVLTAAANGAVDIAWSRFKNLGDNILDLIREPFNTHATAITELRTTIPSGIRTEQHAFDYGYTDEWRQMREHSRNFDNIAALIAAWWTNNIITTKGAHPRRDYTTDMFLYENYRDAVIAGYYRTEDITARKIIAGHPSLATITEVDKRLPSHDLKITAHDYRGAAEDQRRADEAMRATLPKVKRERHQLTQAGRTRTVQV